MVSLFDFGTSQCIMRYIWLICLGVELWCSQLHLIVLSESLLQHQSQAAFLMARQKFSFLSLYPQQHLQVLSYLPLTGSRVMAKGLTFASHWFDNSPITLEWPSWSFRAEQRFWGMRSSEVWAQAESWTWSMATLTEHWPPVTVWVSVHLFIVFLSMVTHMARAC